MANRNEQFVYFTAVLAVALPALVWLRYVGPLRESLGADQDRLAQLNSALVEYQSGDGSSTREWESRDTENVRLSQIGFAELMSQSKSVSEMYREIEDAGSQTGMTVDRIEPGRSVKWSIVSGPLKEAEYRVGKRTYRLELHGLARSVPVFLAALERQMGFVRIQEVGVQMASGSSVTASCIVTVLVETLDVMRIENEEGSHGP